MIVHITDIYIYRNNVYIVECYRDNAVIMDIGSFGNHTFYNGMTANIWIMIVNITHIIEYNHLFVSKKQR